LPANHIAPSTGTRPAKPVTWCGGVSRVAKGADCKSGLFSLLIKRHSEKTGKFSHNGISRLGRISENASRRDGHATAWKGPQVRDFFAGPPAQYRDFLNHAPNLPLAGPGQLVSIYEMLGAAT
jgi:hypothetical protein